MRRRRLGRLADVKAFGLAFHVPGYELIIFLAGILGVSLSFAIPFNLMRGAKSDA